MPSQQAPAMPGFGFALADLDDKTLVSQFNWVEARIVDCIVDDGSTMLTRYLGLNARRALVENEIRARRYVRAAVAA